MEASFPIVGFRVFDLREEFNIWETGTNAGFFSDTDNEMYGLQIGGQGLLFQGPRFRLETTAKAGVFYDDVSLFAVDATRQLKTNFTRTAFAGELQLTLSYQVGPRMLLRTGYQALWLSGVGKAPDQSVDSSISAGRAVLATGDIIYQGGFLGLEITW